MFFSDQLRTCLATTLCRKRAASLFFKLSSCNVIQDLTVLASQMHPNALIDSLQYKVNPIKLISPEQLSSKILSYTMVL